MAGLGIGRAQASAISCVIARASLIAFAGSCSRDCNSRTRRVHADVSKAAEHRNSPGKVARAGHCGTGRIHTAIRAFSSWPAAGSAATSPRVAVHADAFTSDADGSCSRGFGKSAGRVYTAVSQSADPAVGRVQGSDAGCFAVAKCGGRVHANLWRRNAQGKQRATRDAPYGASHGAAFVARFFDREPGAQAKRAETKRAGYDSACSLRAG
jgi:hypothetical protein